MKFHFLPIKQLLCCLNYAPPPSYDSLFGRVREARKSSSGFIDFFKNLTILLIGTIGCGVIVIITFIIPVTMIIVGLVYLHECPNSEYIPIFLLVGGGFGVLKQLLHLSARVRVREEEREEERVRQTPTQTANKKTSAASLFDQLTNPAQSVSFTAVIRSVEPCKQNCENEIRSTQLINRYKTVLVPLPTPTPRRRGPLLRGTAQKFASAQKTTNIKVTIYCRLALFAYVTDGNILLPGTFQT
ncbi:hypothetical protein J6590_056688 [Homalodisca vitripennis]|nr:hypothetical protein J6590_056688 [Homalodisca vitripennis]